MDREADPPTQLMIDEAILDYLIYTAIRRILESPGNTTAFSDDRTDLPLEMVGSFLPMFKCLHPDHDAPVEIRFRLRLLRFTYVVTRRRHRTSSPLTTNPRLNSQTQDNRFQSTESSSQEQLDAVSLHKTLPSFLALSAAQNALQESTITELWMRLAAGYMAQAYAEDVLIHTRNRSGLLEEAFKWGYDADCSAEEGSDQWLINEMFDADQDVLNLWEDIKEEHMSALRAPEGISLTTHLEALVSSGLSITTFKEKISEFLMGLLCAHPAPLLSQIEGGKVDGLSRKATAALKKRAGFI